MAGVLILDSGSTKTKGFYYSGPKQLDFSGPGINPYYQNTKEIEQVLKTIFPEVMNELQWVYFYGAGCSDPQHQNTVKEALSMHFPMAKIEVNHDLLGAARAVCQDQAGVVGILGTGSNACVFDGHEIIKEYFSIGFLLGDEGSGAVLGRQLAKDYFEERMPKPLRLKLEAFMGKKDRNFLKAIYASEWPNRYLAQLTRWFNEEAQGSYREEILQAHFQAFFQKFIFHLDPTNSATLYLIGSVAKGFESEIRDIASQNGIKIGQISGDPLPGLVQFHKKNIPG